MPGDNPQPPASPAPAELPALSALMAAVLKSVGALALEHHADYGDDRIHVAREHIAEVCRVLRDTPELALDMCLDVTAVDYFGNPDGFRMPARIWDENRAEWRIPPQSRHHLIPPPRGPEPRFAVVYHLLSTRHLHRLRIKVRVPEDDPTIETVSTIWPSADWLERETYDLYGIHFTGHPDLRRIYLYDEFVGHPLRKDYAKEHEQPIEEYAGPGAKEPRRPEIEYAGPASKDPERIR
ncbi:MAG TPA: NADH-quinone oxidoreductase subunit C [Candidatus Binataceae bacterium]|jgi:NADH-quinone oxidoreductase subunit C|nr:NADH-quinone oxidoreductase subunit C [Candidatus Binataceae bacterium]